MSFLGLTWKPRIASLHSSWINCPFKSLSSFGNEFLFITFCMCLWSAFLLQCACTSISHPEKSFCRHSLSYKSLTLRCNIWIGRKFCCFWLVLGEPRDHHKCGKLWGCGCLLPHFAAFCLLACCVRFPDVYSKHKPYWFKSYHKKGERQKIQNHIKSWFLPRDFWKWVSTPFMFFCDISWLEWARELRLVVISSCLHAFDWMT